MPHSPYINRFLQPDTIIPSPSNPQSWNRYSYVVNNPLRYVDPTGHAHDAGGAGGGYCDVACQKRKKLLQNEDEQAKNNAGGVLPSENEDKPRKPGEPRCKTAACFDRVENLSHAAVVGDMGGLVASLGEAAVATYFYGAAAVACAGTGGVGCGPAFAAAWGADVAASVLGAPVENWLGYISTGLTAINDYYLGNTGYDPDIGPYIGKDTIVSLRNTALGSIPESYIDLATSASQFKYDLDREAGKKSGGYVPIFDANLARATNAGLPPFSREFLSQVFLQDWW